MRRALLVPVALVVLTLAGCYPHAAPPAPADDADVTVREHHIATVRDPATSDKPGPRWEYDKSQLDAVPFNGGVYVTGRPGLHTLTCHILRQDEAGDHIYTPRTIKVRVLPAK